ncbi:MAG TPA: high-affinity nickel-transport family protein, partial [Polyangiaceae bacterium]
RHATDADHVVAVTTIVSRERSLRSAAFIGVLWGLGHSVTLLLVGGAMVLFRFTVSAHLGLSMGMAVALMLVLLGTMNLTDVAQRIQQAASGEAQPRRSATPDTPVSASASPAANRFVQIARPIGVGVVHGLAGSVALALLVSLTIPSVPSTLAYLVVLGVGTMAGMVALTVAMAAPLALAAARFTSFNRTVARATGLVSIVFGAYLAYRIGFVDGLFLSHPTWKPQ